MTEPTSIDEATQQGVRDQATLFRAALRWSWPIALRGFPLVFLALLFIPDPNEQVNFLGLLRGTAVLTALLLGGLVLGHMVNHSRQLLDRLFAWTGFAATFFGLVMLLVFFLQ